MLSTTIKKVTLFSAIVSLLSGCATTTLLKKHNHTYTRTEKVILIQDDVVAFGRPSQSLTNIPKDSLVIAGQKNSYVLTQGGSQFFSLISQLDSKHIQVQPTLDFYSEKNDGTFSGELAFSYVKLREDVSKKDLTFFIENSAKECSSSSDDRMKAQRFCFSIKLSGLVYPIASNITSLRKLSKPYHISIYTNQVQEYKSSNGMNPLQKLVLFPFAVAIDVVSLPFQAAEKIFE